MPTTIDLVSTRQQHRQYPSVLQRLGDITATAAPRYVHHGMYHHDVSTYTSSDNTHGPASTHGPATPPLPLLVACLHIKHLYGEHL